MKARVLVAGALSLGLTACGTQSTSDIKVTNGKIIDESVYPSVVLLYRQVDEGGAICTGTFINKNTVLTAAHCVRGNPSENDEVDTKLMIVKPKGDGSFESIAKSTNAYQSPSWDKTTTTPHIDDVGLVVFPEDTSANYSEITDEQAELGKKITIVGYGNNDNVTATGAGTKRLGTNTLKSFANGFLNFEGALKTTDASGKNASAGPGDSGGPMFQDDKIVGITSGGGNRETVTEDEYVDLSRTSVREFIDAHTTANF
ncbi:MAG: trypsin-like serine protease [Oligoflexales bacterium]